MATWIAWALSLAGTALWVYGYFVVGTPPFIDWQVFTPHWIAVFVPNREAEIGCPLSLTGAIPIYWNMYRDIR